MSLRSKPVAVSCLAAVLLAPGCAVDPKTGSQSIAGITVSDDPCAKTARATDAVIGAGLLGPQADAKAYRDPKTFSALADFWKRYLSKSGAKLEQFGQPALLQAVL